MVTLNKGIITYNLQTIEYISSLKDLLKGMVYYL